MSEYIIWESDKTETTDNLGVKHGVSHFEKREEIVRCRDCKHFDPNDEPSEVYPNSYWCDKLTVYMPPNGFCPWGKRREVE